MSMPPLLGMALMERSEKRLLLPPFEQVFKGVHTERFVAQAPKLVETSPCKKVLPAIFEVR
jgi:hypothetical protein